MIVLFEGIDGTGKTTQAKLLKMHLEQSELSVLYKKCPGSETLGNLIKSILLDKNSKVCETSELLLFMAEIAQMSHEISLIKDNYDIIILDRWIESNFAYQGLGQGWDISFLKQLWSKLIKPEDIKTDLNFIFTCNVSTALHRSFNKQKQRTDNINETRIEEKGYDFFVKVDSFYRNLIDTDNKYYEINCDDKNIEDIHNEITSVFWEYKSKNF